MTGFSKHTSSPPRVDLVSSSASSSCGPSRAHEAKWLRIGAVARRLGVCNRTLERLDKRGLVPFRRVNGVRFLPAELVLDIPAYTLGRAAAELGVSYERLRRRAAKGQIPHDTRAGYRRVAPRQLREIQKLLHGHPRGRGSRGSGARA